MFVKSLFFTAVTISLSLQVNGHATFAPNQAAADAVKRSDIKRAPNPCVAATALKAPIPIDAKGQFVAFARSFNAGKDGATTIKAGQVDASAVGQNFKDGAVTEVSGGVASQPNNKGRQTVTFVMPKGVKCAGGADKSSCLVTLTTSAGFVNCVAVTQAGSNSGAGTKGAAGNKQAASSSAEATATASNSATSTANPTATETGSPNSDSQASQQVTAALQQVQKIKQELDALVKSLGGTINNNQNSKDTAGAKKAAAAKKKAAAAKKAADKKAQDAQKNDPSTTSPVASATETTATESATATSSGAAAAETGTGIIARDVEEDDEDDDFSDLDELSARDLENDEGEEDDEVEDDEE